MLRTINLVLIGLLVAGAGWTFMVKHNAEEASEKVSDLKRQLANEQEEIDLLRADWALLNSPGRMEQLVKRYNSELGLNNLDPEQIVGLDRLPEMKSQIKIPVGDDNESRQANGIQTDRIFTGSIVRSNRVPSAQKNPANKGGNQ